MDQYPQYLTWMKSKHLAVSHFRTPRMNTFNKSCEEQAFANDVAFVWPPRSYSCSFCKRKFRSAQALGGHMNVHRRDRARLRLSHTSQYEDISPQNFNRNPYPDPNSNPNYESNFLAISHSPCSVSDPKYTARKEDFGLMGDDEANVSICLNSAVPPKRPCGFEFVEGISSKRLKTNVFSMPFFDKPCSNERLVQGLDLELRLGDASKLK